MMRDSFDPISPPFLAEGCSWFCEYADLPEQGNLFGIPKKTSSLWQTQKEMLRYRYLLYTFSRFSSIEKTVNKLERDFSRNLTKSLASKNSLGRLCSRKQGLFVLTESFGVQRQSKPRRGLDGTRELLGGESSLSLQASIPTLSPLEPVAYGT